jgi:hypothetical protein
VVAEHCVFATSEERRDLLTQGYVRRMRKGVHTVVNAVQSAPAYAALNGSRTHARGEQLAPVEPSALSLSNRADGDIGGRVPSDVQEATIHQADSPCR